MVECLDRDYLVPYAHVTPFQSQRISIFVFCFKRPSDRGAAAAIRPEFSRPKGVFPFICATSRLAFLGGLISSKFTPQ